MQPQTPPSKPVSNFKRALFSGWLAKALTVSFFIFAIMVSTSFLTDLYYQQNFSKLKKANPSQVLAPFASPSPIAQQIDSPSISPIINQVTDTPTPTLAPHVTATPTPKVTQVGTNTPTPTHVPNATNTPTSPPQATNTNSPTPTTPVLGCYVVVSGYLYNMQSGVGTNAVDPNTGKSHVHTIIDYRCGTQVAPTDMTAIYLEKHLAMGCAPRLAPYIVNPPAPQDPTCE